MACGSADRKRDLTLLQPSPRLGKKGRFSLGGQAAGSAHSSDPASMEVPVAAGPDLASATEWVS